MLETSRQRLVERGEIVHCPLPVLAANGKTTVFGFLGDGVLEHHHGSHLEGATHGVRNVVAFDAQRRLAQAQCLSHIVHGLGACAHIRNTAHLAALQRLVGVLVGAIHELLLVASGGHTNGHRSPALVGQPAFEFRTTGRFDRHDDFARHRRNGCQQISTPSGFLTGIALASGLGSGDCVRGGDGLRRADGLATGGDGRSATSRASRASPRQ